MLSVPASAITRREALRRTLLFSTAWLAGNWAAHGQAPHATVQFSPGGLHLLAVGDYGSKTPEQKLVAQQMAAFARQLPRRPDGVLALGDNFYGKMTPERWVRDFEQMYDAEAMPCPFHVCLGNHDYEMAAYGRTPEPRKTEVQLEYARQNPGSRWKLPAKWYTVELPSAEAPLLKVVVLDSNYQIGALTPQEKLEQKRFLEAELAKSTKAPWTWLMWHHPIFTQTTKRADNPSLRGVIEEALRANAFSICITGHDHNLQHLQVEPYQTQFIVSGAGGARTYEVAQNPRGFAQQVFGFNHFHLTAGRIAGQFIDAQGKCLHAFTRTRDGVVKITT